MPVTSVTKMAVNFARHVREKKFQQIAQWIYANEYQYRGHINA